MYALSNKNTNSKMERWKSILEEYNSELNCKLGKPTTKIIYAYRYKFKHHITWTDTQRRNTYRYD